MIYLFDTNVVSELFKSTPNPFVANWTKAREVKDVCISVMTLGEMRKGVGKIHDTKKGR